MKLLTEKEMGRISASIVTPKAIVWVKGYDIVTDSIRTFWLEKERYEELKANGADLEFVKDFIR